MTRNVITPEAAVELLSELVRCPSVNPSGRPATEAPLGEARLVEILAAKVRGLGGAAEVVELEPGRANLVGCFEGRDDSRTLLLEAHADTVAADGMAAPFEPVVRDGRLYGRGACDTKGSMVAMLLAIEQVLAADGQPPATVILASTCDEEIGATGAKALVAGGLKPDAAIVGEPTDLEVVHASKGAVRFRIETHGRAAHSSAPDEGVNAISAMARIVGEIERSIASALRSRRHELLGSPTISVGTIAGGTQVNVVADFCRMMIDRRLIPGETVAEATEQMLAALDAVRGPAAPWTFTCEQVQAFPPFCADVDEPVVRMAGRACREVLGAAVFRGAPWSSNAGFFAEAGIPSVLFGPGSIQQAHTRDEFIEIDQIVRAAKTYVAMIRDFGRPAVS